KVTAPSTAPTTLVLIGGGNRLLTDNQANVTLWVQGSDAGGNATLTLAADVTNHGTIQLESVNQSWSSNLTTGTFTLTNAADGTLQANRGTAGNRILTGNLTNLGAINVAGGITLTSELTGGRTLRLAGGTVTADATSTFLAQNGAVTYDGGTI